jgi:DNA-binding transcriptional MerR regulator
MAEQRDERGLLKVGEFSGLGQVTIKSLYLYDRLGLLRPARVDPLTGYRLYSLDQLPRLNRILALKDLGFSLSEVARLLHEDPSPAEMRGMLRLKRAESEREIAEAQGRLARVEARLRQIEREGAPPAHDVVLKEVGPMRVASSRRVEPTVESMVRRLEEAIDLVGCSGIETAGPSFMMFYHQGFRERDLDVEVAVPVGSGVALDVPMSSGDRLRTRELEGSPRVASLIYRGSYDWLAEAYAEIGAWVAASGYRAAGPAREIYLRSDRDDPVTEIQYPVEEA